VWNILQEEGMNHLFAVKGIQFVEYMREPLEEDMVDYFADMVEEDILAEVDTDLSMLEVR